MKKSFLVIICFFLASACCFGKINYDLLYGDTPVLDYIYESGEDPEEDRDYEDYIISPYTLVRLPVKLRNKNTLLTPGYYLVKPEKKDGYRFAVFKQNGKVIGVVPIYKKEWVNPAEEFPTPPKPQHKWYIKPFAGVWNMFKWPFKKLFKPRKPLIPSRAKVNFEQVGDGKYYDMLLYVEDSLYRMLFRIEK